MLNLILFSFSNLKTKNNTTTGYKVTLRRNKETKEKKFKTFKI